jgi:hypothetical protein
MGSDMIYFDFTKHRELIILLYYHQPRAYHRTCRHSIHTAICLYYALLHAGFPWPQSVCYREPGGMQLLHSHLGITYNDILRSFGDGSPGSHG